MDRSPDGNPFPELPEREAGNGSGEQDGDVALATTPAHSPTAIAATLVGALHREGVVGGHNPVWILGATVAGLGFFLATQGIEPLLPRFLRGGLGAGVAATVPLEEPVALLRRPHVVEGSTLHELEVGTHGLGAAQETAVHAAAGNVGNEVDLLDGTRGLAEGRACGRIEGDIVLPVGDRRQKSGEGRCGGKYECFHRF